MTNNEISLKVRDTLLRASTTFSPSKYRAYADFISKEKNSNAKWALQTLVDNADAAKDNLCPLCDDTGIPHLFLEISRKRSVSGEMLDFIYEGVKMGLEALPGRPMAIGGNDLERIDQSGGVMPHPSDVEPAPLLVKHVEHDDMLRLHVLMFGGGPAIRAKTYRVFHKHNVDVVKEEIISWAKESTAKLGCTPATLAVGIGRSHYEAASLMLESLVYGDYDVQSSFEKDITDAVNSSSIGPLGLGGGATVLGTFVKIGPQRSSGVRIVCMRPCCCMEPRKAYVDL